MVGSPLARALAPGLVFVCAFSLPARADDLFAGIYAHGLTTPAGSEHGADFALGYRTSPLSGLFWLAKPSVGLFVSANTQVPTDFAGLNLNWRLPVIGRFYVRPAFGMAYTTGQAGIGNTADLTVSPAEHARRVHLSQTRIDFGSHVLFNEEVALGYQLGRHWGLEAAYVHFSNGEILHHGKNQGLDDAGLRLVYAF